VWTSGRLAKIWNLEPAKPWSRELAKIWNLEPAKPWNREPENVWDVKDIHVHVHTRNIPKFRGYFRNVKVPSSPYK
jgi:hypothetical protein